MKKLKLVTLLLTCILFVSACSCSREKFEVTFDSNGGPSIDSVNVLKGDSVNKPTDPVREGYVFGGWFIKLDDTNSYDFSKGVTSNLTLIAKWIKISNIITVTFDSNGGSSVSATSFNEGEEVSLPTPTRSGYTFLGWYSSDTKIESVKDLKANTILTAKWQVVQSTGGSSSGSSSYKPTPKPTPTPDPTPTPTPSDTLECVIENVSGSTVGQIKIFVVKNGTKINGSCDITTESGSTITKSIDTNGYLTNKGIVKSVGNAKEA